MITEISFKPSQIPVITERSTCMTKLYVHKFCPPNDSSDAGKDPKISKES